MLTLRRTGALLTAAAAVAGLIAITGPDARTETTPPPVSTPSGWLALTTGATDRVAFDRNSDGTPEATQPLSAGRNCLLSTNESLLTVDGFVGSSTTEAASFASDSIGVAEKKTGTSCAQVGAPGERLVLQLNPTGVRGPLGPLVASSAYLDVELKQSARILATARLNGEVTGQFELRSGSSPTGALPGAVTPDEVVTCSTAADSGPDSGISDNCRWPISSPSWRGADDNRFFDSLTLQAVNGSFSVEGGGDGAIPGAPPAPLPSGASIVELVQQADGVLACGGITDTEAADGIAPQVTVRRLDNADPGEVCDLVPYTLTNDDSAARFLKPLDEQGTAQFVMDVVWTVPADSPLPLPVTTADYESADPRTGIPVGWCPDPLYSGTTLVGIANPLGNPAAVDQDDVLAGKQFTCLGTQSARVVDGAPDQVLITEQIYVLGDLYLRK